MKNPAFTSLLFLSLFICFVTTSQGQDFPGKKWNIVANPSDFGYSKKRLDEARDFANTELATKAVVVVVHGKILYEWGSVSQKYILHSARKSLMSALYGKYVKRGIIDITKTMAELGIDDKPPLEGKEKTATVRDCLMARSGIYHPAVAESRLMELLKPKRHSHDPGTFWCYNNWDSNVLLTIFKNRTGKDFYQAFKEDIADPIMMEDYSVEDGHYMESPASIHKAYHIQLTARDFARFGLLMLQRGYWNGTSVIPPVWVRESTAFHSDASLYGTDGYGYQWWVAQEGRKFPHLPFAELKNGAYSARGAYGQYLIIIPDRDMVIVHMTDYQEGSVSANAMGLLVRMILDAATDHNTPLITVDDSSAEQYVGKYELRPNVFLEVSHDGGKFSVQRTGLPKETMVMAKKDEFYTLTNTLRIIFERNRQGKIGALTVYQLSRELHAPRLSNP